MSVAYQLAGDRGLVVEFANEVNQQTNSKVHHLAAALTGSAVKGLTELVPSYRSLLILYDPLIITAGELIEHLHTIQIHDETAAADSAELIEIPTVYGGQYGQDLEHVADYAGITAEEVIKIHSERDYYIYMLGFTPGFPYLGGLPDKIAAPRLKEPRVLTPAGSVGIAGTLTGIYSIDSPGGWRIIGRTPLKLFDPSRNPPFLLKAGDYLRFVPVDYQQYERIEQLVIENNYQIIRKKTGAVGQ